MEHLSADERFEFISDIFRAYLGRCMDINYNDDMVEMPNGISFQKIEETFRRIQGYLMERKLYYVYQELDDFDHLMSIVHGHSATNAQYFCEIFTRQLDQNAITLVVSSTYRTPEERLQKVKNILFEDYYRLRALIRASQ